MDEANTTKEKAKVLADNLRAKRQLTLEKDEQLQAAKEKIKTIVAKAIEAFQQTDEYNTVPFSWYYKGFELLWQYLIKHFIGVDLGSLYLEEVDKEMEANEAFQPSAVASEGNAPKPDPAGGDKAAAWTSPVHIYIYVFFLGAQCVFGLLIPRCLFLDPLKHQINLVI